MKSVTSTSPNTVLPCTRWVLVVAPVLSLECLMPSCSFASRTCICATRDMVWRRGGSSCGKRKYWTCCLLGGCLLFDLACDSNKLPKLGVRFHVIRLVAAFFMCVCGLVFGKT